MTQTRKVPKEKNPLPKDDRKLTAAGLHAGPSLDPMKDRQSAIERMCGGEGPVHEKPDDTESVPSSEGTE